MPVVTLPDGSSRSFDKTVTVAEVAKTIGPSLAKAMLAGRVNDCLVDGSFIIKDDVSLAIITAKDPEGLEVIRHSTAHLMAMAVQDLYPSAQVTIGPVIKDGFYYDFSYDRGFTPEDLRGIEERMQELVKQDITIERQDVNRLEAIQYFRSKEEHYKVEIISDLPEEEKISLYRQGGWMDLCRGPHVPSTGKLKAFKLMRVAGAYWRGDSNNEMLTRIYGTAWEDKKALQAYLKRLEEIEKRDHRKIGKRLNLFHTQEEAPGMVFWHPNGWIVYKIIRQYMSEQQTKHGYQEVNTPQLMDSSLWEKSGHLDKYHDHMFMTSSESRDIAIKPMNCPCHVQVYKQGTKSYRDLPFRLAEFGSCHRNEPSGALHGIMRVRAFTQDDGHIFIEEKDIVTEVVSFIKFLHEVYRKFGFAIEKVFNRLSTRPSERVGSDAVWDNAEKALADALNVQGLPWEELPGEGAFYGPKIEFVLQDSIGRLWQCGTIQVDFSMPARLGAEYVDSAGDCKVPVMLHRAILGSFERFIGILIEHYEGVFPIWLAPVQAVIFGVTDRQKDYVLQLQEKMLLGGFRVNVDLRNEKVGFKIREHSMLKVPYQVLVGDKEQRLGTVAVRTRTGDDLGMMSLDELMEKMSIVGVEA